jgi:preprotein translocase subunit SecA
MKRDIDYVIQDGKVALVDQHTGRIFPERKWRDGLHQAIEIREGAELTAETNSFARISRQRFFKMYQQGTGMTGTASDAVDEFKAFFSLPVVPIPLNQPSRRIVMPSRLFADETSKLRAIVDDAILRTNQGQPVLIGTRTVSQSQDLSSLLNTRKASHELLNGIQDADEAAVIQSAGRSGVITVATNMAGRGTDIKLDADARDAGGLHVIAAEPNRSRRVDRQLIGRTARQGDPGSCQLFAAADDELVDEFASPLAKRIRRNATASGEAKLDADSILLSAQQRAEAMDFKRRQRLMQHDRWIDGVLQTLVGETDGRRAG